MIFELEYHLNVNIGDIGDIGVMGYIGEIGTACNDQLILRAFRVGRAVNLDLQATITATEAFLQNFVCTVGVNPQQVGGDIAGMCAINAIQKMRCNDGHAGFFLSDSFYIMCPGWCPEAQLFDRRLVTL